MGIPKPLVQTNQLFIFVCVLLSYAFHFTILILPLVIGLITLVTKKNVVILLGSKLLRKPKDEYIQEDKEQQLFNQWIATTLIGLALVAYLIDFFLLGHVFSAMVLFASGIALLGFCIGCFVRYRWILWKYNRQN
ncbi:magnesium-transporting ATPase (P-type) [Salirhabdus euzebyi]|uniref:Magnesium-transporting ATPase (P-type) n=1 Tax=Salirhabdus euzebyi TaxID=394506 RepID=A0A841PWP2_9BACI|nr:DUF4395 domain-containing protein [Salirhabdus euzebyi]MBB6452314.1 magnesium-transporting ATPase (P-type) [Salirhabdus euzebyi]